jgi:hypothetical protein
MRKKPNQRLITTLTLLAARSKDFAFFDKSWCPLCTVDDSSFEVADTVQITWRIQKNCRNGQTITLSSNSAHPDLSPIRSTLRLVLRARRLKQQDTMPLQCYCTKKSPLVYLTASRMAALIQEAVKKVLPGISAEDLSKIFCSLATSPGLCPPGKSRQEP